MLFQFTLLCLIPHLEFLVTFIKVQQYLFGDLDEQNEDDEDKEVVKNAHSSDDDVDDLEMQVTLKCD